MAIATDIAAIRARTDMSEEQKRKTIYDLKGNALVDVIYNGSGSIPPLIQRTFTTGGLTIYLHKAEVLANGALRIFVTLTRAPGLPKTEEIILVNPPVLPRSITGNERQDLIQAAVELLEGFA